MTNQFTSIYGQLFCCNCPGGLNSHVKCENQTGEVVTYPMFIENAYAWITGILGLLLLMLIIFIGVVLLRKHNR